MTVMDSCAPAVIDPHQQPGDAGAPSDSWLERAMDRAQVEGGSVNPSASVAGFNSSL